MQNFKFLLFLILAMTVVLSLYATTDGQIPEPARPMPYTDFISIEQTGRMTIDDVTQIATGGFIIINNGGTGELLVASDTTVADNGFIVPENAVIKLRLWNNQALYLDCSTTTDISYIRGN